MSSEGNTAREGERTSETSASAMGASTSKTAEKKTFLGPFAVISLAYILFTTTDGAVRMLVLMHAYAKGFTAMEVAIMFTLYELCGAESRRRRGWGAFRHSRDTRGGIDVADRGTGDVVRVDRFVG